MEMNLLRVAGYLQHDFIVKGFPPTRWTVDNLGKIEMYFSNLTVAEFRVGPNNRWEWNNKGTWVGYTKFKP